MSRYISIATLYEARTYTQRARALFSPDYTEDPVPEPRQSTVSRLLAKKRRLSNKRDVTPAEKSPVLFTMRNETATGSKSVNILSQGKVQEVSDDVVSESDEISTEKRAKLDKELSQSDVSTVFEEDFLINNADTIFVHDDDFTIDKDTTIATIDPQPPSAAPESNQNSTTRQDSTVATSNPQPLSAPENNERDTAKGTTDKSKSVSPAKHAAVPAVPAVDNEELERIQNILVEDFEIEFAHCDKFPQPYEFDKYAVKEEQCDTPNSSTLKRDPNASTHPVFGKLTYEFEVKWNLD